MGSAAPIVLSGVGGAIITGLFGLAFLFLRRRTEREQLNALVIDQAVKMAQEHRTEHAEDLEEKARLRDECKGLRQDLAAAEARASHAEQELRARDAADVLTHQLIDRLQGEIEALRKGDA